MTVVAIPVVSKRTRTVDRAGRNEIGPWGSLLYCIHMDFNPTNLKQVLSESMCYGTQY